MAKILVVEDDESLRESVAEYLAAEHNIVDTASTGAYAVELLRSYDYDLIVLDLGLPDMTGLEICSEYRGKGGAARVLMLTGKGRVDEKESGFNAGADDYLTKPFHPKELVARVKALMRRSVNVTTDVITVGPLVISPGKFAVTNDGQEVKLTPREFALLEFLARNQGQVFSPESILDKVWPSAADVAPESIKVWIKRLREKIKASDGESPIKNVFGVGYKLEIK